MLNIIKQEKKRAEKEEEKNENDFIFVPFIKNVKK